jgi:hypothetical protein
MLPGTARQPGTDGRRYSGCSWAYADPERYPPDRLVHYAEKLLRVLTLVS